MDLSPERHLHLYSDRARGALCAQRALGGVPQPRASCHHRKCQAPASARLRVSVNPASPPAAAHPGSLGPAESPQRARTWSWARGCCGAVGNKKGRLSAVNWQNSKRRPGAAGARRAARQGRVRARACMDAREERARPRRSQCLPQLHDSLLCGGNAHAGCSSAARVRHVLCGHIEMHTYISGAGAGRSDPTRRRA